MKTCYKCKLSKDFTQFSKDKSRTDHLSPICKQCRQKMGSTLVGLICPQCQQLYQITYGHYRWTYRKETKEGRVPVCRACNLVNAASRRKDQSLKQLGENNPNWKGGVTSEVTLFYTSAEWKKLRLQAMQRDNFTCQDCGARACPLQVNHIKPRCRFPELKLVLTNLETLCVPCHGKKKWIVYEIRS